MHKQFSGNKIMGQGLPNGRGDFKTAKSSDPNAPPPNFILMDLDFYHFEKLPKEKVHKALKKADIIIFNLGK